MATPTQPPHVPFHASRSVTATPAAMLRDGDILSTSVAPRLQHEPRVTMCDKNLLLVATIEKYPCLYNHNLQDYMKKDITEKAWIEVSLHTSLTVAECKEKWRNLRYSLLRSLKPNADGTLKKKYYLHKEMEFLIPFMKSKATGFISQFEEEIEDDSPELNHDVKSPQQQLFEYEFLSEPLTKRKRNFIEHHNNYQPYNECRKQFMLGLMPEVNALTEEQMKMFRRKVLVLLDEITEGSEDSPGVRQIKSEPVERIERDGEVYVVQT